MAFAVTDRCCVFSLPGNPVAALLTFELLVRPALRQMAGRHRPIAVTRRAILGESVRPRPDRMTLRRVRLERTDDQLVATSSGQQATGFVRTLSRADGIALIPSGTEILPAGTVVDSTCTSGQDPGTMSTLATASFARFCRRTAIIEAELSTAVTRAARPASGIDHPPVPAPMSRTVLPGSTVSRTKSRAGSG